MRRAVVFVALVAVGCASPSGPPPGQGTLDRGRFWWVCAPSSTDPLCALPPSDQRPVLFPDAIAAGARFTLEFSASGASASSPSPSLRLVPASPLLLEGSGEGPVRFRALRPGRVAVLVQDGDRVRDYRHLAIVQPELFAKPTKLEVAAGVEREIAIAWAPGVGGELAPLLAECEPAGLADVQVVGTKLRVKGRAAGAGVVRARFGTATVSIDVAFSPAGASSLASEGPSADGGTDGAP